MGSRPSILAPAACAIASAVGLASCTRPAPPDPPLPAAQDGWTVTRTPVLQAGSLIPRAMWNDPSVVRVPSGYVMYATTSVGEPWKPPVLPFRLISSDGQHWSLSPSAPLVKPVAPYESIETPSVVQFGRQWHMFFTGVRKDSKVSPMSVGHAISPDGIRWSIDRPVLIEASAKPKDWRSYLVAEPGAVVVGNQLLVYFSAVGARTGGGPPQDQSIGVVASSDGRAFSPPRRVLAQGGMYRARDGFAGYSSPAATVIGGRVHLFYSVAHFDHGSDPEWRQVAIHHAVSPNGLGDFVEDLHPVLTLHSSPFAGGEVIGPAPLVDGGNIRLWFGAHVPNSALAHLVKRGFAGPEFGIGEASTNIGRFAGGRSNSSRTGSSR